MLRSSTTKYGCMPSKGIDRPSLRRNEIDGGEKEKERNSELTRTERSAIHEGIATFTESGRSMEGEREEGRPSNIEKASRLDTTRGTVGELAISRGRTTGGGEKTMVNGLVLGEKRLACLLKKSEPNLVTRGEREEKKSRFPGKKK